jgi:hypothetical protein
MGDFNLDLLKYETHNGTDEFINTLGTSFFQPHILQPTRITDHTATLIDNIFFNSMDYFTLSGNLVYDVTDHLPNFLIINKFSSLNTKIKIFRRDYSKFNEPDLIDEVRGINWQHVLTDPDPSTLFEIFLNKMSSIIDKHLPIKHYLKKNRRFNPNHG